MWILQRTVKFCWSFGMQFAENVQANRLEGYCFIMTMPDPIQSQQPRREFKYSGDLFEHPPYSPDLVSSDFHLFGPLKTTLVANVSLITNRLKRSRGSGWDNSQSLLCCGFRRTGNATVQVYQCWWRICGEIRTFSRFEYHKFYVLYPLVTYLLTLPRN
jgi:hypothetical protein